MHHNSIHDFFVLVVCRILQHCNATFWVYAFWFSGLLFLGGCAGISTPSSSSEAASNYIPPSVWDGRFSLVVSGAMEDGQAKTQSFFSSFVLSGNEDQGHLRLLTPFGGVLADLDWGSTWASLTRNRTTRYFSDAEALLVATIGQHLPLAAIFNWLHGKADNIPGWKADLSQLAQGRLRAERTQPKPRLRLHLLFAP